jgi:hypothetical protein
MLGTTSLYLRGKARPFASFGFDDGGECDTHRTDDPCMDLAMIG